MDTCPARLPLGVDRGGRGFGTHEPATETPSLLSPGQAWVCEYVSTEVSDPVHRHRPTKWNLRGDAVPVPSDDLSVLASDLRGLRPRPVLESPHHFCSMELGPRWMLVYSHQGDLTGVVVDGFGCRDVRLTDQPFSTAAGGSQSGDGTVAGVLTGPSRLLDDIAPDHTP